MQKNICKLGLGVLLVLWGGCRTTEEKETVKINYLQKGNELYEAGNYNEAYSYFRKGIPSFTPAYGGSNRDFVSHGRVSVPFQEENAPARKAEDSIIISVDRVGEECFYRAMDCLVREGDYGYVINRYERYLDYFPNYRHIDEVVANIKFVIDKYEEEGEEEAAMRGYRLLVKIDAFNRDGREARFRIAEYNFKRENYAYAIEDFKDIIQYFPGDARMPEVYFKMGLAHFRLFRGIYYDFSDLNVSEKYFRKYLEYAPEGDRKDEVAGLLRDIKSKNAEKLMYKGKFYMRRGDYQAARGYFTEVKEKYKDTPWALKALRLMGEMPPEEKPQDSRD